MLFRSLFSKCPITSVDVVALDSSSNTSNVLLQILLNKVYGRQCAYSHHTPDLESMTIDADAALLIGDNGYEEIDTFPYVYDLGQEWFDWTGLPFVYAVWTSRIAIDTELANLLHDSHAWGLKHLEFLARNRAHKHRTSVPRAIHYFTKVMEYSLSQSHLDGLALYSQLVRESSASLLLHQY